MNSRFHVGSNAQWRPSKGPLVKRELVNGLPLHIDEPSPFLPSDPQGSHNRGFKLGALDVYFVSN